MISGMKWAFLFMAVLATLAVSAQELTVSQLINMLDWPEKRIDTTIKKKGYVLLQKDLDSTSRLFQYSNLEKKDDMANVRAFTFMDAVSYPYKSRLFTYRTYSKDEYQRMASWLLTNNYRSTDQYEFEGAKHTVYSYGMQTVRMKVGTMKFKDKRSFTYYEIEIGK
jgi:hypothetical protein